MSITTKLVVSKNEILQILAIQQENHYSNLPSDLKTSKGFVTVLHSLELLLEMKAKLPQIIADDNGTVVGYALAMLKELKENIPVLIPMFNRLKEIKYFNKKLSNYNYYVMGQICIANSHKGKGIFKLLYAKHKEVYSKKFDLCITEVSSSNIISMNAHLKTGFKTVHTFKDSTDEWNILVWNWS